MQVDPFKLELARAWELKINVKLEESIALLGAMKQSFTMPTGQLTAAQIESLLSAQDGEQRADILVLTASVARTTNQIEYAEFMLQYLEQVLNKQGRKCPPHFFYEKGMLAFTKGDQYTAFECFSLLINNDEYPFLQLCALGNYIFCLENMGLSYMDSLQKLSDALKKHQGKFDVSRIENQIDALHVRCFLRDGDIKNAVTHKQHTGAKAPAASSQALYVQSWLKYLPFHRHYLHLESENLSQLVRSPLGFLENHSYRMRTLQGVFHPDDVNPRKPSELADRIYLWVWRWLINPEQNPFPKISVLLKESPFRQFAHRFTFEDRLLIRNATYWISLFEPRQDNHLAALLALVTVDTTHANYPLFDLEYIFVRYLIARRDNDGALANELYLSLSSHPLWSSKELLFKDILESIAEKPTKSSPKWLSLLTAGLNRLLHSVPTSMDNQRLIIERERNLIFDVVGGKKIYSESMSKAFDLLHVRHQVSCSEFVSHCFGFSTYRSDVHEAKIFNLLARMRKIIGPDLRLKVRDSMVIAEGQWQAITFSQATHKAMLGGQNQVAPAFDMPLGKHEQPPFWLGERTRKELERMLQRPRSTTNRLIAAWEKAGLLKKIGLGKNTTYIQTPPFKGNAYA